MITGGIALLAAFAQINPIWQFGPYDPAKVSSASQPDWYLAWIDGALRIMPSWEWSGWGHTIPFEVFLPGIVFPGIIFGVCLLWPAIESRLTGDRAVHDLLDRPWDRPKRTAFGAAYTALLVILTIASWTDVVANYLHLSLNTVLWTMRVLTVIVPVVVLFATWRLCSEMQGIPSAGRRKRSLVVRREPSGAYAAAVAEPRPGDRIEELNPIPVPDFIEDGEGQLALSSRYSSGKQAPR